MKRTLPVILLAALFAFTGSFVADVLSKRAMASRNGSGTYSLPAGNPVTSGTTISSSWANTTLNDIGAELTNSLDRQGRGAMSGPLQLANGTSGAPSLTFGVQTNTGIYRAGASDIRMSIAGSDAEQWVAGITNFTGNVTATGDTYLGTSASNGNDAGVVYVFQRVMPIAPAPQAPSSYPLGNDLWTVVRGAADQHIQDWSINFTATTTVSAGSHSVALSVPKLCPSTNTSSSLCQAQVSNPTTYLCPPSAGCSLIVDEDTANEETITAVSPWSILTGTTIQATFAKSHTQPYNIRQVGALYMDTRFIGINANDGTDRPVSILDRNLVTEMRLPNDTSGTFPKSAIQLGGVLTGDTSTNTSVVFRNVNPSACIQQISADAGVTLINACELGGAAFVSLGDKTANSLKLYAAHDVGRVIGGGDVAPGIIFYGNNAGSSTGTLAIRNNPIDDVDYFTFNASTGIEAIKQGYLTQSALGGTAFTTPVQHASGNPLAFERGSNAAGGTGGLVITFNPDFGGTASCTCADENATPVACGISSAATTHTVTFQIGAARADVIDWMCWGPR